MKKLYTTLATLFLLAANAMGQTVSSYSFVTTAGTYTEIIGSTILGTGAIDDDSYPNLPIGFTFTYNGVAYTKFSVNANGFLALGTTISSSYSPISTGPSNNIVCAIGRDLQGNATGQLAYVTSGIAPNRVLTVQWKDYRPYAKTGYVFNFQIKLSETSNKIEVVYGSFVNPALYTCQVGIRGAANTDFNNRTTTANWAATTSGPVNTSTCDLSSTVYPAGGLTLSWYLSSTPTPTNFTASAISTSQINLAFTPNGLNNVIIVWNNSGSFSSPSGVPPAVGSAFGNGTLLCNGTASPVNHTGLNNSTIYYYAAYTYSGSNYSGAVFANATTVCVAYNVPYSENFESAIVPAMPPCASIQNAGTGNNWITALNPDPWIGFASKTLKYPGKYNSAANAWFYTGGINLSSDSIYNLSFKYGNSINLSNNTEKLKVYFGTLSNNASMTNLLLDFPAINQQVQQTASCSFMPPTSGVYYLGFNCYSDIGQSNLYIDDISITCPVKSLKVKISLEGLYDAITGIMAKAQGDNGGYYTDTIADQVKVKLAQEVFPYSTVFEMDSVNVSQNGSINMLIPGTYSERYYIVVSHRNSIETWSTIPVSFNQDTITYNFADENNKAFHNNLKLTGNKYSIYAGDINQDGFVDNADINIIGIQSIQFVTGYHTADANGDGVVDALDLVMVDNNASVFARSYYPNSPNALVVTTNLINTQYGTAHCGGTVTAQGSSPVITRGICWSINPNPSLTNDTTKVGSGAGSFTCYLKSLLPNTTYFFRAYATNSEGTVYGNELSTTTAAWQCGTSSLTINHSTSGGVAPVDKTVTYGTVAYIPGESSKCWITSNLGASNQATAIDDASEASAGWYWHFNRKQGFKHDGTSRTPVTTWINDINENSDWVAANDPCALELGSGWRIPTLTEWTNVDASGGWTSWTGPWNSGLKLHAAGYLDFSDGSIVGRGFYGVYWTSMQYNTSYGWFLVFYDGISALDNSSKAYGWSARCINSNGVAIVTPTVNSDSVLSIGLVSAISGGNVTSDGGAPVTERGVCWSTAANPTIIDSHTSDGTGTGTFVSNLTSLSLNTLYYVRAYATNSAGTSYGDEITFTTPLNAVLPTLNTSVVSNLNFTTASCGGNVTFDGWATVTARGVCWSTSSNPSLSNNYSSDGTGAGEFTSNLFNLASNTLYYVWAYATNSVGTTYGNEINFTTLGTCGTFTINHVADTVAPVTKTVTYNTVTNIPGEPTKCWITQNLGATNQATSVDDASEVAAGWYWQFNRKQGFKHDGTTRTPNTTWINNIDENSDWDILNDPCAIELGSGWRIPTSTEWQNVAASDGWTYLIGDPWNSGLKLHAAGFLYDSDGSLGYRGSSGIFWSSMQNSETIYGLGFYSGNSNIFYYSKAYGFTARCLKVAGSTTSIPTVTTASVTNITQTTATSGGIITTDGGAIVTARGVCWGTTANPTITDNHTSDGDGTGVFASSLINLTSNTLYFVRAYATNSIGTAYGSELSFTTLSLPSVISTAITNICSTSATSGGNITFAGSSAVTARGVCWSTTSNPTITNNHTSDGTGTGAFVSNLAGLSANTLYYVRAYATNSVGTAYGTELTLTTLSAFLCGCTVTVNHIADTVAPVTKTVTYGTVGYIPGESSKCWITSNLGATNQASSVSDATEAAAGWYWQFNRKQGFKHDGTTRTPATTWISSISENPNWVATNDPCILELGSGWRLPTSTEWTNVDASGGWTTLIGPWNSDLKLHAAGFLYSAGSLSYRGSWGYYWSSTQGDANYGWALFFNSGSSGMYFNSKAAGSTARCINSSSVIVIEPTVTTTSISNIGLVTAISGGNVTSEGGATITARGVCWSASPNPTITNSHTSDGTGYGLFVSSLTGLTANTLYYIRSYATNSAGTAYGNEMIFTTLSLPTLTTTAITNICSTSATSGGNITFSGLSTITARGVCWSISSNPTIVDSHTSDGTGTGAFVSNLTSLGTNILYYVRAYATNSVGTAYGAELTLTTSAAFSCGCPLPIYHIADSIAPFSKTVNYGTFINIPGEITKCWITQNLGSTNQAASVTDATEAAAGWYWQFNKKQGFKHDGSTRTPATTWISGISENSNWLPANDPCALELGSGWRLPTSTEWSNVNASGGWTTWTGSYASGLKLHAAGQMTNSDGSLNGRGFLGIYWSSAQYDASNGWSLVFNSAFNSMGIGGKASGFTARCLRDAGSATSIPTVTTASVTSITLTTSTSGGIITTDGGSIVTARGVCWGTTANPTIMDNHSTDGTGVGAFVSNLTGLSENTLYYVRAFATNGVGTAYGNDMSFTTLSLPSVITTAITNICSTSATSGGNITLAGSSTVIARGVCWSISSNPTIVDSHTSDGTGTGAFVSNLTALGLNTLYYVRAYATNSVGTAYGTELTLTTSAAFSCGCPLPIYHIANSIAPVSKTVTYGTITNIPGEPAKCWITQNLGATNQATSVSDATEATAGWYWQFNKKQGYKLDGTTRTPASTWINSISENSDWVATNDPCTLEFGSGWRLPTSTEWSNVDATGGWTTWTGPWNSGLKLHAAGYLGNGAGSLINRGVYGSYWSSTQYTASNGWYLRFYQITSFMTNYSKAYGFTARCIKD